MKFIKIICISLCFFFLNLSGMQQPMPFRVGFEFQMNGRLCEWALHDYSLQKKPIFTIESGEGKLCRIELDGPDIEFVTEPFSNKEGHLLAECMKNIKAIINLTKDRLDAKPEIDFDNWLSLLSSEIGTVRIIPTPFFDVIKTSTIRKLNPTAPWEPSWQPQMTVQHPLQSTITLCNTLFPTISAMQALIKQSIPTKVPSNTSIAGLMFLAAHEMVGMTNSYLMPLHTDHILDLAMALAIYFHGQDLTINLLQRSIIALSDPTLKELETHTLMRPFLTAIFEQDAQKQSTLLSKLSMEDRFVQRALAATANIGTFVPIANDDVFMYKALLMRDTFESFSTAHQFDAKRWTNFMSRRPFSHMFIEIIKNESPIVSDVFSRSVLTKPGDFLEAFNQNIEFADQLPGGFYLANYAEQFFDETGANPIDLKMLLPYFHPTIRESTFLNNLLQNGIFSTTMFSVMNIDETVPNTLITPTAKAVIKEMLTPIYSTAVLSSIEQPQERSFLLMTRKSSTLEIDAAKLPHSDVPADLLSPPFLLDKSDAMGQYREGVFHAKYTPEAFGSAIVEFRNIQQAKHLKSKRNSLAQAGFLTIPDFVEEEALNVFVELSKLTMQP